MESQKIKIGEFSQDEDGMIYGSIGGLGMGSTDVVGQKVLSQKGNPYYRLIADPLGASYEVGSAFPKEKEGVVYFSIILDSPLFPAPLNGILYPNKGDRSTFNLLWDRGELKNPSPALTTALSPGKDRRTMATGMTP